MHNLYKYDHNNISQTNLFKCSNINIIIECYIFYSVVSISIWTFNSYLKWVHSYMFFGTYVKFNTHFSISVLFYLTSVNATWYCCLDLYASVLHSFMQLINFAKLAYNIDIIMYLYMVCISLSIAKCSIQMCLYFMKVHIQFGNADYKHYTIISLV